MGLTKPIEQNSIKLSRYIYVSKDIIRGGKIIEIFITYVSDYCSIF